MSTDTRRKIIAGARMRRLRGELGLSQSGMAGELGISVSYLNLVERNQRPVTAQLLIRLAEIYAVDPREFAGEEDARAAGALEEIFADPLFQTQAVPKLQIREFAENAPAIAQMMTTLYRAYREVREVGAGQLGGGADAGRGEPAAGPMAEEPLEKLRSFLQASSNYFPELEERSEAISLGFSAESGFFNAVCRRLAENKGVRVQVVPADVLPQTLRRYDPHRRKLMISELVEPAGRSFHASFQLALLEAADLLDSIAARVAAPGTATHRLGRVMLANYFAAALMMPYEKFLNSAEQLAYDVPVLAARFSASFEQVAHRLTTLARPSARGVPFFMVRIDRAGNVSKRFSSGNFPFARFGGTCPRWNIHQAFRNPGQIEPQIIELPDRSKWFSIARTVRQLATPWGEPEGRHVIGLGCELRYAPKLVYSRGIDLGQHASTEIGVSCRLCERLNCAQRAAPPLLRRIDINENVRGLSPFDTAAV